MTSRPLVVLWLLAAGGCGLKGDLYLPEEPERPATSETGVTPDDAAEDLPVDGEENDSSDASDKNGDSAPLD